MLTRKIQRVGRSTLTVSLPKKWEQSNMLKKGDVIACMPERDGSLRLMPIELTKTKKRIKESIVAADLCDEKKMLERVIIGNYVTGRDMITVVSSRRISNEHIAEIRNATIKLLGLGIIEEEPNRIVLQCSIDPTNFPMVTLMRRLFTIISTMCKEASDALVNLDLELAKEVINRENEADMIYWLIIRLLMVAQLDHSVAEKIGLHEPLHLPGYRLAAKYLETIADYAENIAKNIITLKKFGKKPKKAIIDILAHISGLALNTCDNAIECLFTGDMKKANIALKMRESVDSEEDRLTEALFAEKMNSVSSSALRNIGWSLQSIAEYGSSLALISVNRYLEKSTKLCRLVDLEKSSRHDDL